MVPETTVLFNRILSSCNRQKRLDFLRVLWEIVGSMKLISRPASILVALLFCAQWAFGFLPPARLQLANIDKRKILKPELRAQGKEAGLAHLQSLLPTAKVDWDKTLGTPHFISVPGGLLTAVNGAANPSPASLVAADPYGPTKTFLDEHRQLFGHGSEVLANARIKQEFTGTQNGLHSVMWEQQLDGIGLFEGTLISHTTKKGELVNLSSHFLANLAQAADAGTTNRAVLQQTQVISLEQAVAAAAQDAGETLAATAVIRLKSNDTDAEKHATLRAPGVNGEISAHLVWLPISASSLKLCWEIVLVPHGRGEMFKTLVDAQTGEIQLRHNLTDYLSDATYRVYTSDSPTPFSPGYSTPATGQPATVARQLITTNAFDTNASPAGWINDGVNETQGNNVDAHTDHDANDQPDLPRPQGSPNRVFDFTLDLTTQDPTNYANAAVTQLFFLCNWYHDRLYELGFTEAAGNFQSNNFGRGGIGNDAVQADAQDGSGFNNANFSTPSDGSPGRMQMYIFTGPSPRRDGDLDAEVVFHEHTHGVSNRRVGGGVGISALQPSGMGEGWSDFFAMCLLSDPSDDVDGTYAFGGYVTYLLSGLTENYYFGIRHYPYTTDMTKNPFTFKDIDPTQAIPHTGVPISPIASFSKADASEVHHQGEVWCVTLWEARANLIKKYGWSIGNQLVLKLVLDGMTLSPVNPTFTQARDAIIQADVVDNGGANTNELWAAFAKRGLGFFAYAPDNSTTTGVGESFSLPDNLMVTPLIGFTATGSVGGSFSPSNQVCVLTNTGAGTISWSAGATNSWLALNSNSGSLTAGNSSGATTVFLSPAAYSLPAGIYQSAVIFTNNNTGVIQAHPFTLNIGVDYFTEIFSANDNNVNRVSFTFTPDGSFNYYTVCRQPATNFPTDPTGGTVLPMQDDNSVAVTPSVPLLFYGSSYNTFYVGSNGYLTLGSADSEPFFDPSVYFDLPRISGIFADLNPGENGIVSYKQLADRVAVTYSNVTEYFDPASGGGYVGTNSNNFQIEMFFNGTIRLTYLRMDALNGNIGLSQGLGQPDNFFESNFTNYPACQPVALAASLSGTNLVLSWPAYGGAYVLQHAKALNQTNWSVVTNTPAFNGAQFLLTNQLPTNQFFRLRN